MVSRFSGQAGIPSLSSSARRLWPRAILLLALAAVLTGCGGKPNVLLITFDTMRADHMGYAGGPKGITPVVDKIAARGTWFSTCITAYPYTLPSHTSIMTGLYPYHTGVRDNGTYVVPKSDLTLATILQRHGYATHAIVSAFVLDHQFGLNSGFGSYDDDLSGGPREAEFMIKEIRGDETAGKAVKWLKSEWPKKKPFFLWVHFFDPHADFPPPAEDAALFPSNNLFEQIRWYSADIHFADRELGRIFAELAAQGLEKKTLIVFTADHGQGLGEHGEKTHGLFVYDSTVRVPLIFAGPGVPKNRNVGDLARTVDILPTTLDLLGIPVPKNLDGKSLRPLWKGETDHRVAYTETMVGRLNFGWAGLRSLRNLSLDVIDAPRPEVYDLLADPGELHNLATGGAIPSAGRPFFSQLKGIESGDPFEHGGQQPGKLSGEAARKLAALGYVTASVPAAKASHLDPKDAIAEFEKYEAAVGLIRNGKFPDAIEALSDILKADPQMYRAMDAFADALVKSGQKDRALAAYARVAAEDPQDRTAILNTSRLYREKGNFPEAFHYAQIAVDRFPDYDLAFVYMGANYMVQGDTAKAQSWYRKALAVNPASADAAVGLGECLNREGHTDEALQVLSAVHQRNPSNLPGIYQLAVAKKAKGDSKGALALYELGALQNPAELNFWEEFGRLAGEEGKIDEAEAAFVKALQINPDDPKVNLDLATLNFREGRAAEAVPLLKKSLSRQPDSLIAAGMLAQASLATGDAAETSAFLSKLAEKNPKLWLPVASLEIRSADPGKAREALRKALAAGGAQVRQAASQDPALRPLLGS